METKNKKLTHKIPLLLLISVVIFSFAISAASAASTTSNSTIYVSTQGNDTWDGLSAIHNNTSGPKATIANATGTVATNGTVYIAKGTYNESGININTNMTIVGESQKNTIINGKQSSNPLFIIQSDVNVTIVNLTLTNSTGNGAIISDGNLTVTNSTFAVNSADAGGAIYTNGNLTVVNSTFTDNTATDSGSGGAIYNNGGTLTVTNSTFTGNNAQYGGAIYNDGTLNVTNTTFISNTAYVGGAIYNDEILTVTNTTFTNNIASYGGAIYNDGTLNVTNTTFTNNTATDNGGAIYNDETLIVTNSSFKNNKAINHGESIWNSGTDVNSKVNFNRIVGNSPNTSEIHSEYGTLDATLNWWGSNFDPSIFVTGEYGGIVNVTSWLVLNVTANPTTTWGDDNSTVTVDLLHDNNGAYHDPANGYVPDGIPVTFTATNGTLKPTSTTLVKGQAKTVFTAKTEGNAKINATVDDQSVSTQVKVVVPKPSLVGGSYNSNLFITLTMNGTGLIYYTTNGSIPTKSSKVYSDPINISKTTTLKYMAADTAGKLSHVYSQRYTIFKLVSYTYTVQVPYKKGWYKYYYYYTYKHWYRSHGKWKYYLKHKLKHKWKYGWIYKSVQKKGTHYVLT